MKAADATVFQVHEGLCYGVFLSAGHRVEHESGIEPLVRRLGIRPCPGSLLISFDREPERAFFFGTADIDGELHALWALENRWVDAAGRRMMRSPRAVRRRIRLLHDLVAGRTDGPTGPVTTQGLWDFDQFAIITRGETRVAYLETLHLAALGGDLAPTYLDDKSPGSRGFIQDSPGSGLDEIGAGLGLFVAGLAPDSVRARIIDHQTQRGFKGREEFQIVGRGFE